MLQVFPAVACIFATKNHFCLLPFQNRCARIGLYFPVRNNKKPCLKMRYLFNIETVPKRVVKKLSLEAIKQVTEAEQACAQRKTEAVQAARQAVAEAERQGQAELESARSEAEAKVQAMMRQAEARAAEQAEAVQQETERACADLKSAAKQQLEAAAELIVRRVVNLT